jgi:hypothetical protein
LEWRGSEPATPRQALDVRDGKTGGFPRNDGCKKDGAWKREKKGGEVGDSKEKQAGF